MTEANWYCPNCNRGLITPEQADAHEEAGHHPDAIDVLEPKNDPHLNQDDD